MSKQSFNRKLCQETVKIQRQGLNPHQIVVGKTLKVYNLFLFNIYAFIIYVNLQIVNLG